MKLSTEIYNEQIADNSSEEEEDADNNQNNEDSQEDYDEEEGSELEDEEDEPPKTGSADTDPSNAPINRSLGNGNKVAPLKKKAEASTANKKPVAKLVNEAIKHLNERQGSSAVAIKRIIMSNNPSMDEKRLGLQIKRYIKKCLEDGTIAQVKRSFKLTKKLENEQKKLDKEKEKVLKEKQKEKTKQKKKESKEKVKNDKAKKNDMKKMTDKEKSKAKKRPAPNEAKDKLTKKPKKEGDKEKDEKAMVAATAKPRLKVKSRKSINLLVKHTPPRPKTMKKTKPMTGASAKQTPMVDTVGAGSSKSAATTAGRAKKTKG